MYRLAELTEQQVNYIIRDLVTQTQALTASY